MIGTLRRYSDAGGYGFIQGDDGADTFVHISKLKLAGIEYPRVGMTLKYEIAKRPDGKVSATNIREVIE